MIDTNKLRGVMAERKKTQADVAKAIGCSTRTFATKMKKGVFGSDEIDIMVDYLDIDQPMSIFFVRQ